MHMCTDDTVTASAWATLHNKLLKDFYQKRTETSLHKKISKEKSSLCRDGAQCINALADKVHKQEVHACTHTDTCMHSITWPHYSTTIPA